MSNYSHLVEEVKELRAKLKLYDSVTSSLVSPDLLIESAISGNSAIASLCMIHNLSPNDFDKEGVSPLHYAAGSNSVAVANILINNNADVNIRDVKGLNTPLHTAAKYDSVPVAELLLACNADLNAQNSEGETPLMRAIIHDKSDIAIFFIGKSADTVLKNKEGKTALSLAFRRNLMEVIAKLVASGSPETSTLLIMAAKAGNKDVVDKLDLLSKIPMDAFDSEGMAALHWAVAHDRVEFIDYFLSHGSLVDIKDVKSGNTPLHTAAKYGRCTSAMRLIKGNADVNSQNSEGLTPLMRAIIFCQVEMALLLVTCEGLNVHLKNNEGKTALMLAFESQNRDLVPVAAQLVSCGALLSHFNSLFIASQTGNLDVLNLGIAARIPLNNFDEFGMACLHHAVANNHLDLVRALLSAGAAVDIRDAMQHNTPLLTAAKYGHMEGATLLLEHGATVNEANIDGETPLIRAIQHNQLNVAIMFILRGADLKHVTNAGKTAVDLAQEKGMLDIENLIRLRLK